MTDPNVVYHFDVDPTTIDVDVVVGDLIVAGLPVLRPGKSKMTWHLITEHPLCFDVNGIAIDEGPGTPDKLRHGGLQLGPDDRSVSIDFQNDCISANAVSYFINLKVKSAVSPELKERLENLPLHHDPSISVVSDPPAG